uniref:Uncharacterized protein n=1 Tax=Bacillus thuringiensis TaxID=1428 RepID=C9K1M2_BACTU|nr:hypothetical protein [Bacillus thuringiensis]
MLLPFLFHYYTNPLINSFLINYLYILISIIQKILLAYVHLYKKRRGQCIYLSIYHRVNVDCIHL